MDGLVASSVRRFPRTAPLALILSLALVGAVDAQNTTAISPSLGGNTLAAEQDAAAPSAPSETDPEDIQADVRSFQQTTLVLPPAHLLGDWFGYRTRMVDRGIEPTVNWVTNLAGNPVGGRSRGFTECENLGISLFCNLEKLGDMPDTTLNVSMSQRSGRSLTKEYLGNFFNVQQVFGGETFHMVNIELERKFFDGALEVALGRLSAGDDFLVSPYDWFFMQNALDGNPVAIFSDAPGMSAYPNSTWGARFQAHTTSRTYAMLGVYNGDSSIRANDEHGFDFSMHGPAFLISEAGYNRNSLPEDEGLLGHYKAGMWYNGGSFEQFSLASVLPSADPLDSPNRVHGNWGFYALADQVIFQPYGKSSPRGAGVFGSILVAPDESTNKMPFFCAGGMVIRGLTASRPTDTLGFAVMYGEFSSALRDAQRLGHEIDPQIGVQTHELVFEWGYRIRMRDGAAFFQPDLQYVVNPGAAGQYPDALVVGAQAGVNF